MSELRVKLFKKQDPFVFSPHRITGGFAGKRGGKTEGGAIRSMWLQEEKINLSPQSKDPFLTLIVAPTFDMLKNLSWKKFLIYASPFIKRQWSSPKRILWQDGSEVLGLSADKPQRLEGHKANHAWLDECFQMEEQAYLEAWARVSDQSGFLTCTGSLGIQYINPKQHWAYKYFKKNPSEITKCFEWATADNPHYPREELTLLRNTLDAKTFRQMYEIDWDTPPSSAVFRDFDNKNLINYAYNPMLPTYVSIDWGWSHPCAVLFIQYDARMDHVYVMSEIVQSELLLENMHARIVGSQFKVDAFICDIAGLQEREQLGLSNIEWFRKKGIYFQFRKSEIAPGLALVRSYVRDGRGMPRLFVNESACPKLIDAMKRYRYKEKDGIVLNENPLKEQDDPIDALRYFFVNILDRDYNQPRSTVNRAF